MTPERWQQIEKLYHCARKLRADQRAAFLKEACLEDETLRTEVETLLAQQTEAENFIESPAMAVAAQRMVRDSAQLTVAVQSTKVSQTVSHYRILEKLGEGGMGVVYKARDLTLGRTVALKFLPRHVSPDEEHKARFMREAQAASALDHPNIGTVHEIAQTEDGQMFIAMAYYEGEPLKQKIARGPLLVEEALDFARQVAEGLSKAHSQGIVHRDIKPGNVLVTREGLVKIIDFGLAKLGDVTRITQTGTTQGTVAYMSPEQARGEEVDHRTDVWSLGVVLYEMLTGQLPFPGTRAEAVIYSILTNQPKPLKHLRTDVPVEIEKLISCALEKNQNARYPSATELLKNLIDYQSRSASPEMGGGTSLLPGWMRQKRIIIPAVTILLLLGALLIWSLYRQADSLRYRRGDSKTSDSIQSGRTKVGTHEELSSVAVLPFLNLSSDPENEFFSDGLTEELINALTKVEGLRVPARTSVFQFKGKGYDIHKIGDALKVGTVLEGSVRKEEGRVRVTAQLSNVADGYHLWSESYDREMKHVFEIQEEISLAIVQALKIRLAGEQKHELKKRPTEDAEAYQLYMKGRYFWNKYTSEGWKRGLDYFRQASEKDPNYSLAYAGMADCYVVLSGIEIPPKEVMPSAKLAANKALEIDDTLAEAHTSLAFVSLRYEWDWSAAEREFKRAIQLNPSYATAHRWYFFYLAAMGRLEEGIAEMKRAQQLEPLSLIITSNLGGAYYFARRYDEAIKEIRKALEMDPGFFRALNWLGWAYQQKRMYQEALAIFQKTRQLDSSPRGLAELGHAYALAGKRVEAERVLNQLNRLSRKRYVSPYDVATIYVGLGEKDQAFKWLERAYEEKSEFLIWINVNPALDSIRADPRFQDLLKKMKLASSKDLQLGKR